MSRRSEVLTKYEVLLRKNFLALDVDAYSQAVFRTLAPSQIETGSTLPRALFAYQFAIFELITEYSPATLCPFVIDSPNQQGQDKEHLPQILRFIADNQPPGSQLILGIENDTGWFLAERQFGLPSPSILCWSRSNLAQFTTRSLACSS
jgi:hypothetical protein